MGSEKKIYGHGKMGDSHWRKVDTKEKLWPEFFPFVLL